MQDEVVMAVENNAIPSVYRTPGAQAIEPALEPLTACFDKAERLKGHFDGTVPVSDDEQRIDVLAAVPGIIAQICGAVPVEDTSLYICSAAKWAKSNAAERFPDDLKSLASQATFLAGIGPSVDAWAMFGSVYMPFSESNGYSAQRDLLGIIQGEIDSNAADRT
ncbi:hypothetical protein SNK03_005535 [Fusarium graminearum]